MNGPSGLVDANGELLVDTEHLPDPRHFTLVELQCLLSGALRFLTTVHGIEALQLISVYADEAEKALDASPSSPPPLTDEQIEQREAEREARDADSAAFEEHPPKVDKP